MADMMLKSGDLLPPAVFTFRDADGNLADLSTATGATFKMSTIRPRVAFINAEADITEPGTLGQAVYQWQEGDTDIAGGYLCECRVQFPDGPETFPDASYLTVGILQDLSGEIPPVIDGDIDGGGP